MTLKEAVEAFKKLVTMSDFLEDLKLTSQQEDYIKTDRIDAFKSGNLNLLKVAEQKVIFLKELMPIDVDILELKQSEGYVKLSDLKSYCEDKS